MSTLPSAALRRQEITIRSTGCCPSDWRDWWRDESIRQGTDWKTLAEGAETALRRLYSRYGRP
jgi:hypothetical protein